MAELTLTLNCAAAARRVAPASTAAITRSRRSSEYAFVIPIPPNRGSQNPTSTIPCESLRDSIQAEFALARNTVRPQIVIKRQRCDCGGDRAMRPNGRLPARKTTPEAKQDSAPNDDTGEHRVEHRLEFSGLGS